MQIKHNFGAGPCILPAPVLQKAAAAVQDWNSSGLSVLEVSHRSAEFINVVQTTEALVRDLLSVPKDYSVLFMQGGASMQFAMVPLNFLKANKCAAFLDSGYFAIKAIKEATHFGSVQVLASSSDKNYSYIPDHYEIPGDCAYVHFTSNNTIEGTQLFDFPKVAVPVVCDMSSDIFSRKINVRDFDLIYAGAQKNAGPAGVTIVIVKNEFLDSIKKALPAIWDYRVYKDHNSLYNTAPVFSLYATMLNLIWLKDQGGVEAIELLNIKKSRLLYQEIDRNTLFYGMASLAQRSRMNVCFQMYDAELEQAFLDFATSQGMVGIKGFPTMGGFRVSLYNALPLESVEALILTMQEFESQTSQQKKNIKQNDYA